MPEVQITARYYPTLSTVISAEELPDLLGVLPAERTNKDIMTIDEAVEELDKGISKGIIKQYRFGERLKRRFLPEFYAPPRNGYYEGQKLDISIVISEGNFDIQPYLKL